MSLAPNVNKYWNLCKGEKRGQMKWCKRQGTNKDGRTQERSRHIKFSADAALKSKQQVIDGCCMIKVLLFLFFVTEYCTLSQLFKD